MRTLHKYLILALALAPILANAAEPQLDIGTLLMRSTFKIQSEESLGTVFIIGEPSSDTPGKLYYVMITAAHVLEAIKSDVATLHLRKQDGEKFKRLLFPVSDSKQGNSFVDTASQCRCGRHAGKAS